MRFPRLLSAVIFILPLAAAPGGCSDRMIDVGPVNYLTGGGAPPDAASPVRGMSNESGPYPNLAAVPARPTDAPTPEQAAADVSRLTKARSDNRAAADALNALPGGPAPLEIPPPVRP